MPFDHLAPATGEDETADELVRRGRNVGAAWFVASVLMLGVCFVASTPMQGLLAFAASVVLLLIGLRVRARYWRSARRRLGDATLQRAQWRSASEGRGSPDRIMIAIGLVLVLLAFQVWSR